jgi:hypothetical protein
VLRTVQIWRHRMSLYRSLNFIVTAKCRMLRCLVSMEYLRSTYRILMRKSIFWGKDRKVTLREIFVKYAVKFGTGWNRHRLVLLEVLKLCFPLPALYNHRNLLDICSIKELTRHRVRVFFTSEFFKMYLSDTNLMHSFVYLWNINFFEREREYTYK